MRIENGLVCNVGSLGKAFSRWLLISCCLAVSGCQIHHPNHLNHKPLSHRDPITGIHVERGKPIAIVDRIGWLAGTPTKLALWDRRADNHDVSRETEEALLEYMDERGLEDAVVRINQYDPWGEWKRLVSNDQISPGWRYTVGLYNHLEYTLLPGRILGGDWYNPYTNTVNVYSDIAPLAISRAAYAKDIRSRDYPGTYAVTQELPIVGMMHETLANREALSYAEEFGSEAEIEETRRILYPDYGSSWGGQIASFVPFGAPFGRLAGASVGHATNWMKKTPPLSESLGRHVDSCDE